MKSLYLVLLDATLDRNKILDFLGDRPGFGMWFYSMPSSFFIYSSLSPKDIVTLIRENFGDKRCFVVQATNAPYYGFMPNEHWSIVHNLGAEKRYDLTFEGYYLNADDLPDCSGVYCVYRCTHNSAVRQVCLKELLYVGPAEDIRKRHLNHEKFSSWCSCLGNDERVCFAYAKVAKEDLLRCEAALIFLNKPCCNDNGKDGFHYADTYVSVTGTSGLLKNNVLAERTY